MQIEMKRRMFSDKSTISYMFIDFFYECFTLEDTDRQIEGKPVKDWKIAGKTCIPRGTYEVKMLFSPKFKKKMPHITGIEGFDNVMFHWGNTPLDTDGCPLLGKHAKPDYVGGSKVAFDGFMKKLLPAIAKEKVYVTISGKR
jgi:hypothetical protein